MAELGVAPDLCLVGEPTSAHRLGDMMKIGRRGSVNIWITVPGRQGHVAYPHLADNPITPLIAMLAEIEGITLDTGNAWFQPSNIEITDLHVGNPRPTSFRARRRRGYRSASTTSKTAGPWSSGSPPSPVPTPPPRR